MSQSQKAKLRERSVFRGRTIDKPTDLHCGDYLVGRALQRRKRNRPPVLAIQPVSETEASVAVSCQASRIDGR